MGEIGLELDRLIRILENPPSVLRPAILPDFFLDHFVVTEKIEDFVDGLIQLASQGGGNLLGSFQFIRPGGNTVNTASALLKMGLDPLMVITTDEYGASMLKALVDSDLDLSHVHTDGALSATVSIEGEYQGRHVNLMVSDSGSAAKFTINDLTEEDITAIKNCGLVALLNLNHNTAGVEFVTDLFSQLEGNNITKLIDTGDPSARPNMVQDLTDKVLAQKIVDVIGVNENEVCWFAWALDKRNERWREQISHPEHWIKAGKYVSTETGVRVDLHTPYFAASILADEITCTPTFEVIPKITLGAGDTWNAGNIFGILHELEPLDRLVLANSAAALYVSSRNTNHPYLEEIIRFLKNPPRLSHIGTKLLKSDCK
ncbi:MAG: hypothetical protein GF411_11130 [Candidatus Lokiarchaeota archaeon]|nr:hypothetical protein [Candidatus Lokiarchaeota archaeon]